MQSYPFEMMYICINLERCNLDDECLIELAKGTWKMLELFDIEHCKVSIRGINHLSSANWQKLRNLFY
jgi:hypothetical protein